MRILRFIGLVFLWLALGCSKSSEALKESQSVAELRAIKGGVWVGSQETTRAPYRRERLKVGAQIRVDEGGLSWVRRDGGATWLISGPSQLSIGANTVAMDSGRAFVDTEHGDPVVVETPLGKLELADARVSLEIGKDEATAYVLRGSARAGGEHRAKAGERLVVRKGKKVSKESVVSWQDWTGGLGTADPAAAPAPFGIGTVGARAPGDKGKPRSSLVIQRLDVKVTIDRDLAVTEVDQTFVNPSSSTVEGIFRFRTPEQAVLQQFAVDREGRLVWGRVKESKSAQATYESHVYQGSTEDPALLKWSGPGVYEARLYPIHGGATRRVVTRYSQWLNRQGEKNERRLYVYPMAAEGAKSSLPLIEEMTVKVDVTKAEAERIVTGMGGVREGDEIIIKAFDFVPRADLAVELFDQGRDVLAGYRARHALLPQDIPEGKTESFAKEVGKKESDYVAIPLRLPAEKPEKQHLDLAIVVDTSAATEPSALNLARTLASSLLAHLGPDDRAALWAGDASLRPVSPGSGKFTKVGEKTRKAWLAGLASVERGGATDLGALLTEAAASLDAKRTGAVVYIGDGMPSVGEIATADLRKRLARLPESSRILVAAVGSEPNLALMDQVARGGKVEQVQDAYGAARAALSILETAGRQVWMGAKVDLGPGVERVMPESLPPLSRDETVMIVGRRTGKLPKELRLAGSGGETKLAIAFEPLDDRGDLRRRWGGQRLNALIEEGAGRASLVDLSERYSLVSPFTSLYVPTKSEEEPDEEIAWQKRREEREAKLLRWKPWARDSELKNAPLGLYAEEEADQERILKVEQYLDSKEGGTGTRAKGEESKTGANKRYAVKGPKDSRAARSKALREARDFGMIGTLDAGAAGDPSAPGSPFADEEEEAAILPEMEPSPRPASAPVARPKAKPADGNLWGNEIGQARGGGGLGLKGQGFGSGGGSLKKSTTRKTLETKSAAARPAKRIRTKMPRAESIPDLDPMQVEDDKPASPKKAKSIGSIGHLAIPCGPGADLPLAERKKLWRERLQGQRVDTAIRIYERAMRDCEAGSWRERVALLVTMVDRLPDIPQRVELWRRLLRISPAAGDAVYRFLVLRVRTASDLRALHRALGFKQIEPELLEKLLKKAKSPLERVTLLRGAAEEFENDTELALQVLDAYEDAEDEAGGRAWARQLRRRVDATSHLRTSVGEYYLRLAEDSKDQVQKSRDEAEGRRTFGEIVEFAPEDPLSRRHLGDLLSAHGWHQEALRQYETLARLAPDDPTVDLLLARAAAGTEKTERAVRLAEKARATGSPESSEPIVVASRALASVFLAEARLKTKQISKGDLARLRGRAGRLAADKAGAGHRVLLVWSHPELRLSLWTNALGSMMPAQDNLPTLGIAEAYVPQNPPAQIELRLEPEDAERAARLRLEADLFVLDGEGEDGEVIRHKRIRFLSGEEGPPRVLKVEISGSELKVVSP